MSQFVDMSLKSFLKGFLRKTLIYLWLCWVLVATCEIFLLAGAFGIFHCSG